MKEAFYMSAKKLKRFPEIFLKPFLKNFHGKSMALGPLIFNDIRGGQVPDLADFFHRKLIFQSKKNTSAERVTTAGRIHHMRRLYGTDKEYSLAGCDARPSGTIGLNDRRHDVTKFLFFNV